MRIQPKYMQIVGDAVIPLLGLFLWNWSLYFILLFYFLDIFVNEIVVHLKTRKIVQYQQNQSDTKNWIIYGVLSSVFLVVVLLGVHAAMTFIVPGINFIDELVAFWNYKELGIKQGYVLAPLLLIVGMQQFKMTFLNPSKYKEIGVSDLWNSHIKSVIFMLACTGVAIGIGYFYQIIELVYILGIVAISTLYKLRFAV